VSSLCGSADVLEALGVAVELGPEGVSRCLEEAGVGFMFAPTYHPAMKVGAVLGWWLHQTPDSAACMTGGFSPAARGQLAVNPSVRKLRLRAPTLLAG
jgi:hypothetical protein